LSLLIDEGRAAVQANPLLCKVRSVRQVSEAELRFRERLGAAQHALEVRDYPGAYEQLCQVRSLPGYERTGRARGLWAQLAKCSARGALRGIWSVGHLVGHHGAVFTVDLNSDGRWLVSGGADGTVRVWDMPSRECRHEFRGHVWGVRSACISADGQTLVSGGIDETVYVWSRASSQGRGFERRTHASGKMAFADDLGWVLSGSRDCSLRLWDVWSGRDLQIFRGHEGLVTCSGLSSDGRTVVSGGQDGKVRVWKVETGDCVHVLKGHEGAVTGVYLSLDDRWVVSTGHDGIVRCWDLCEARLVHIAKGHRGPATVLAPSLDHCIAVSVGEDGAVRIGDGKTGDCIRALEGTGVRVESVCLSPDGRWLVAGDKAGTIHLWELDWDLCCRCPAGWDAAADVHLTKWVSRCRMQRLSHPDTPPERRWNVQAMQLDVLLCHLQRVGLGWLGRDAVAARLKEMMNPREA
jgi:WD40 repeat protein